LAEDWVKMFADGRCLYCGEFNYRGAEWRVNNKAQRLKATEAEVKEVGTKDGSDESGKD
jgi:hypothetical protein